MPRVLSTALPGRCLTRRSVITSAITAGACVIWSGLAVAAQSPAFAHWVAGFRPRAISRGISEQTYDRVMNNVTPDTSVFAENQSQPEFTELMWQYINRRCSEWRVSTGKTRAK